jgi:hypothetical protein
MADESNVTTATASTSAASDGSENGESSANSAKPHSQSGEAVAQPKPMTAAEAKKWKLKIDGAEEEVDEETLVRMAQKSRAADKRFNEIAKEKAKIAEFNRVIESGDRRAIQKMFGDEKFHNLAVDYFNEKLEEEELTPQERQLRDRERKLREAENELKSRKDLEEKQKFEQLQDHYAKKFDEEFTQALEQTNLPRHPKTVKRMAELMAQNLEMGLELPASAVAKLVEEEILGDVRSMVGALDGEKLVSILGEEVTNRVRKHTLQAVKSPVPQDKNRSVPQKGEVKADKVGRPANERLSKDDFKKRLAAIKAGQD